ncbi:hypothetical protein CF68_20335 [Cupriavidus sp. SK-4]|uniref:toxin-antitoxin system YwqK family antitoxin n=1 Tax=Cupriavidus sp. SK-4 TaxID=574750 RepID=UPI0004534B34|nr:hypothetical protein [Cupriavidus sp. SK-4]EYS96545.1 hypothetical protein CF68_20335 [Cupriavidus sp. SK-4]
MDIELGIRSLLIVAAAAALSACGAKVDCNSDSAKKDALEIIQSHLDNAVWYREMKIAITGDPKLENIKTVEKSEDGSQARCRASYSYTYNDKPRTVEVPYNLAYLEDKKKPEVRVVISEVQAGLMGVVMTERPIKNGEEKIYDPQNGNLVALRHWNKNVQDGLQESYDRQTKALMHQYTAVAGKKEGSEKAWMADGTLITDLTWKDGKPTGFLMTARGSDQLVFVKTNGYVVTQLKDGQKQGQRKTYGIGQNADYLTMVETFKDDQLDGPTVRLDTNGAVLSQVLYRQGQLATDDEATANVIGDCVANWANRYRRAWSSSNQREVEQQVVYRSARWEMDCKEGRFP